MPGNRLFPERPIPEPLLAALCGDQGGEMAGGGATAWMECGYRNVSDRMVILRCLGPGSFFLERVVFPFELLSFACPADSEVEILTHSLGGPELLEAMPARTLRLDAPVALEIPSRATEPLDADNPWLQAG
ncbi:MAG: DUF1830 domain-containing protein [Synechococcaceae cyanobacterium]|nr:DUF1830 domain-containing protein [Synechococcaceae cyanobacterium]